MATGVELTSAYISLIPSLKGAKAQIARELDGTVGPAGDRAGRKFGDRFGKSVTPSIGKIGAALAGVFTAGAAVDFFKGTIQGASALEQSVGGVRAVFGKYAADVERDSARAAKSLGLSRNAYNELITVSGAMLKNKGLDDFAARSENLIKVGADLSAQFGGSTKDAVDALNAAMRGESDPIERYGISLNETAVNAVLAAKGQTKLKGAALETAKTQARLALITKQSADAQGAFARESDTFAGKQARMAATWENLRTELGQKFLPVASKVVTKVSAFVDGMEDGTGAGGKFVDVLSDAADIGEDVVDFFKSIPGPVKKFGVQIGLAATAIVLLNRGMSSIGGSAFVTGMRTAEGRMTALRTQAQRLGAGMRNLAGAGGMMAIADSSNRSSKALGVLQGAAGGAALGFAVGGPWGAAIGGAAGGLYGLWKSGQKAGDGIKAAKEPLPDYIATLDEATGKITQLTRAQVDNALNTKDNRVAANVLGLSMRQLSNAALGSERAWKRIKDAQRRHLERMPASVGQFKALNEAIGRQSTQIAAGKQEWSEFNSAQRKVRAGLSTTGTGVDAATGKITDFGALLDHVGRKNPKPKVKAETAAAMRDLWGVDQRLKKIDGRTARASVQVSTWLNTSALPKPLAQALGLLPGAGPAGRRSSSGDRLAPKPRTSVNRTSAGAGRLTITNWSEGTGYFELLADDRLGAHTSLTRQTGRAL